MNMKRMVSIALLAFTGAAAACGDDSTGPDVSGTFQLEVSGALEETAQGPAWFGSDVNEEGDPVFLLLFGDGDSRHVVIAGREGSGRPGVGTYTIGENGWEVLHVLSDDEELLGMFFGTEGEIRITSSSSRGVAGTLAFVASGFLGEEEAAIEGSISFEAAPATAMQTMSAARSLR
jgi:hypothetical protein